MSTRSVLGGQGCYPSQETPPFPAEIQRMCAALVDKPEAAAFLKVLANTKRLLILHNLTAAGELSVEEIAEASNLRQPSLSQHLAKLRAAGFVRTRRNGKRIYYSLSCDPSITRALRGLDRLLLAAGSQE